MRNFCVNGDARQSDGQAMNIEHELSTHKHTHAVHTGKIYKQYRWARNCVPIKSYKAYIVNNEQFVSYSTHQAP